MTKNPLANLLSKKLEAPTGVGGTAKMQLLTEQNPTQNSGFQNDVLDTFWKHAPGLPFKVTKNGQTAVIFLTDIQPVVGYKLVYGWSTFAQRTLVASPHVKIVGDKYENVPNSEWVRDIMGKQYPRLHGVAVLLDGTSYTSKTKGLVENPLKVIEVSDKDLLMPTLASFCSQAGQALPMMLCHVSRSGGDTSAAVGDRWQYDHCLTEEELDAVKPTWKTELAEFNLSERYRTPSKKEFLQLIAKSAKVLLKNDPTHCYYNIEALDTYLEEEGLTPVSKAAATTTPSFSMNKSAEASSTKTNKSEGVTGLAALARLRDTTPDDDEDGTTISFNGGDDAFADFDIAESLDDLIE